MSTHPAPTIAVSATHAALLPVAHSLAQRLHLPCCDPLSAPQTSYEFLLEFSPKEQAGEFQLQLRDLTGELGNPTFVDFVGGAMGHRRRHGGGRTQPLARAVGFKPHYQPTIVDATGGLGRDAFVLAHLGATVTIVERSPVLFALLEDGLRRARRDDEIGQWIDTRLHLVNADANQWLTVLDAATHPDVIYLDPMYPHRSKSALVKKEMRLLRTLVGDDADAPALLTVALTRATRRVVVKRPRQAPMLGDTPSSAQIDSKTTRFDIYITAHAPATTP